MASPPSPDLNKATSEELVAIIHHQSQLIEPLRKQVEELLRKSHRQVIPFSKNRPTPARETGQGSFHHRKKC